MKWACICAGKGDVWFTQTELSVSLKHWLPFCWFVCYGFFVVAEDQPSIIGERTRSVSSSSFSLSSVAGVDMTAANPF